LVLHRSAAQYMNYVSCLTVEAESEVKVRPQHSNILYV